MSAPIFAATEWNTNADMILSMRELGYLRDSDHVYDPTYGKGNWWKRWRPESFLGTDLDPKAGGVDFRKTPWPDKSFDAITYDPPYVCVGGRTTSGTPEMHAAYGLTDAPRTPALLQELINDGLTEMHRLVRPAAKRSMGDGPNGIVLVKCQNYVSGGKLWLGDHHTLTHALELGFECWDWIVHIAGPRPQPSNRTRADGKPVVQQHARRNLSTLFVLRRPA